MNWISQTDIVDFMKDKDYDLRKSGNGRWIDQKCTPDVITIIADCILNYSLSDDKKFFSSMDVWHAPYTTNNVESIFKKPNPDEIKAKNEYDKFFQQPMEMLAYSGVLSKIKIGNRNFYSVANYDLLEFLSLREKNSLLFLQLYITKVLSDSEIYYLFDNFFSHEDENSFYALKEGYSRFIIRNTPINGKLEASRIFTKVINPLAYEKNTRGTEKGRLSKHKITFDMLMYNRDNFRDINSNKPKDITRKEHASQSAFNPNESFTQYLSQKAKRFLRLFNDQYRNSQTEVSDPRHKNDAATQVHHIFPESSFPEISSFYENLIVLTPTQHFNYAHPNGKTYLVSRTYQHICLIAKASNIKDNLNSQTQYHIYEFQKFLFVLYTGLKRDSFLEISDGDYSSLIQEINIAFQS